VRYLPPFERIKGQFQVSQIKVDSTRPAGPDDGLVRLVQALLIGIEVDEAWYLAQHADVAAGVRAGYIRSAQHHFLDHGYFEGRTPFRMPVDEIWYMTTNADVAEQVRLGNFESGQAHFDSRGYREGRLPRRF
jgi:hypothetical protein